MLKTKLIYKIFIIVCLCSNASFADTIKIGIVGPFSGPYVAAGDQQWLGAMQAVEDINAEGGINGDKLELVSIDDACDPKKALKIAKQLVVAKDIKAVIGHNCSAATLVAAKIYADANMLMITPASTTPEITAHNYNSIFRTCGKDNSQGEVAAYFITNVLKVHRVVIIHDDSVYGKVVAENTKTALDKLGNRVILYKATSNTNSNNAEIIKQISELAPDLIYFGGLHTDAGNFLKYLRDQGNDTAFFGSDGIASPDFIKSSGGPSIVNGVYMTFFNDPSSFSEARKVVKELEKKHITPTGYTLNSYAAVQAIAAALENVPQDKMSDWLHKNEVDSVLGTLEWDANGDLKESQFIVYRWDDEGNYKPYWSP